MTLQELFNLINIPITIKEQVSNNLVLFYITQHENLPSIMKKGLIPQIGDRAKQIENSDGIYLFESKEMAEDALMNWLGDEYDENEHLSMLRITIPNEGVKNFNIKHDGFSVVFYSTISPEYISVEEEIL